MKHIIYITLIFVCFSTFAQNRNFTYDNLGRLTQIQFSNGTTVQYSYDANGNRMQHIVGGSATAIDLAFSSFTATPTTTGAGGSVNLNATNTNTGNGVAPSQYVKVWRSTDTIINAGDVLLDSMIVSSVNAMGNFSISNWAVTIPSATTAGAYYLIIKTDANNIITETNENNNTKYVSLTVTACPTISITETVAQPTCGNANGGINMAISGGTSPYQYSITNGATFQSVNVFSNLTATTYTCQAKDVNGCIGTKVITFSPTGGSMPTASFTNIPSNQTVAVNNTSTNATNYAWDFGDGYTTNSANPSHTYLSPGLYNICLTATNACGSAQSCQSVYVGGNPNISSFSKVYYDAQGEIAIRNIIRTHYKDGWIMTGYYSKDTVIASSNTIRLWSFVMKIDNTGEIVWKKVLNNDYDNAIFDLQYYGGDYSILLRNSILGTKTFMVFDDFGVVFSSQQTNSEIISTSSVGTSFYLLSRVGAGASYEKTLRLRKNDIYNNNQWQKDVELKAFMNGTTNNSYIYLNPQIKATKDSGVAIIGTVAENSNYANNYLFIIKYDKQGNLLFSKNYLIGSGNYTLTYNEDKTGNLLISTYNSISSFKINGQNGSLLYANDAEVFLNTNHIGNKYYFNKNDRIITTDSNFNFISSKKINSSFIYKTFMQNRSGDGIFYINAVPSSVNSYWPNSYNSLTTLDSNLVLGNTCLTDSVFGNSLNSVTVTTSNMVISETPSFEYFSTVNLGFSEVSILDSNLCYINNCNVVSNFLYSKTIACFGDTVTFTNNSTNATSQVWYVNGVNSGTGNQLQKIFNTGGTYVIKLVAISGACADTSSYTYVVAPVIAISTTNTPQYCGQSNASINISAINGTAPYTYSINNGTNYYNANVFTGLNSGTYTATVKDVNGCIKTTTINIPSTPNTNIAITTALNIPICSSTCNGAAIVSTTGGNAPYTYSITPSATQSTTGNFSGLCASTIYTLTAMDATGCTKSTTFSIAPSGGTAPTISITSTPTNATVCNGQQVTLSATGGTTYSWSGGITNGTAFTPSATTTYTVTVTNASGCTATATRTVTVNSLPTISISATPNDTICAGTSLTLTATGGTTYSWTGGITNGIAFTPTASGTYTVTATGSNGCTKTQTQSVVVKSLPTISISASPNDTICAGTSLTLTATGGTTYSWTGSITNGIAFTPTASGTYTVTATGSNGCTKTQTQSVVVNSLPTISISASPNDTICAGTSLTLTATGGTTYSWTGGITNGTAFTPTASGTYTVTATGSNGCTNTQTQSVVVNALPTISVSANPNDTVCLGTTVTLTATGGTSYSWTGGVTNGTAFTPTAGGTYTVSVINANGCTNTQTQSIVVNPLPTISIIATPNDTICTGSSVTLTATGGITYLWTGGVNNGTAFTPTASGTYTVTVTNANGCTKTQTQSIVVNTLPTISVSAIPNDTVCAGNSVTLTATGGGTYSWTGGITNGAAFTPTANGIYTVTATGSNGCTNTQTQSIVVNTLPTISVSAIPNDTVCAGNSVTLTATGGGTYSWTGGITNGTAFTPTTSGTYTVTATGSNGCTNTQTQSIVVNTLPTISVSAIPNDTVCAGTSITLTGTGGTTYSWTGGITNGTAFAPTTSGTYTVTATGSNGCTNTQTQSVVVNTLPTISVSALPNDTVCAGTSITLTGTGGTTYSWSGGITNGTAFTPTASGIYTVTATGSNGCTNTQTQTITIYNNPLVTASVVPNDTICSGDQVTLTGSGANSYSWSFGVTNNVAFTPPVSATYVVTGTDTNGCFSTDSIALVVNSNIIPTISISSSPIQGATGDPINYTATTNVPLPYSIEWYRNSFLSFTGTNNTWNDVIVAGNNSVYAVIKSTSQCLTPDSAKSNQLEILNITGINNIIPEGFTVYPNPTDSKLTIDGLYPNDEFVIYDASGKTIFKGKASTKLLTLDVNSYANGMYQIHFVRGNAKWVVKFIKQ